MPGDSVIVTRVNVLSTGKAGAGSSKVPGRPLQQWSRVWIEAPPPISVGARTLTLVAEQRVAMPMYPRIAADTLVIIAGVAITAVLTRHLDIGLRDNSVTRTTQTYDRTFGEILSSV